MIQSVRKSIKKTLETVQISAYLGTNQTGLNGNAWNKINLNQVVSDLGANYDTSTFKFTAPVTGLYRIRGDVHFTNVVSAKRYLVAIYKNGAALKESYQHSALVADLTVSVDIEVFLTQTDYIELYANPEVGGGVNTVAVVSGSLYTSFSVRLLTKEGIRQ